MPERHSNRLLFFISFLLLFFFLLVSYCWDEPEGEKEFEVQLADSKESLSFKPTKFGVLGFMYYENHIYLAAPATFPQR